MDFIFSILKPFLAGVLTLFTPCIISLLPVYLTVLSGDKKGNTRFIATLYFVLGFTIIFTLIGFAASWFAVALGDWKKYLLIFGAIFVFLLGLNYLNIIKLNFLKKNFKLTYNIHFFRNHNFNSFLLGCIYALAWTPCAGPVLGAVLTYVIAETVDYYLGAIYLVAYSLGVGLPLILLSVFYELISHKLQVLRRHSLLVERFLGIMMIIFSFTIIESLWKLPAAENHEKLSRVVLDDGSIISLAGKKESNPRLIMFYFKDCPICKKMKPVFDKLKSDCSKFSLDIIKIDVKKKENSYIVAKFNIRGVPTFSFLDSNGVEKLRLVGELPIEGLRAATSAHLSIVCQGEIGDRKALLDYLFNETCGKEVTICTD